MRICPGPRGSIPDTLEPDMDRVWMERLDRFSTHDGREIAIECAGVAEITDGLITEVRADVDRRTWEERNRS